MVNWKRPLTLIYRDNHKFGTALYEPTLDECERRYTGSLGRTSFRPDRPDLPSFGENSILQATMRRDGSSSRASSRPKSLYEDLHEQRQLSRNRSAAALNEESGSYLTEDRARTPRRQLNRRESGSIRDLKSEIEDIQTRIAERERCARQDASALRDIMGGRVAELTAMLRQAEAHNVECQKILHRQAQLMNELQTHCQELDRRLADTIDELAASNNKCRSLHSQLESLRD
ncbi:uncharacterized protein LOC100899767 [Galendromus occidentalis]|uniref:Uncharacterized protein LOC100899767 n=1 Tax=Galendromus occidentalis TaxID=34638 RepID=A0AAJ7L737_9ACAR|nr:uncharacterized protein LOC100899767 [Galendromus occidentalis]